MDLRWIFLVAAGLLAVIGGKPALGAPDWPIRPVLTISPFTAGSANDVVARLVLDQVGQQVGQAFIVENRSGGGGVVGVASVVRAEPDGYTLLLSSASMSSAVVLHSVLPYDALRDLVPIAMMGVQPSVLVAAPGKGFKTVAELVGAAKAKTRPAQFCFGRDRLRLAYCRRALSPRGRIAGPAHSLSRSGRGADRSDDRTRRLLFPADRGGAAADQAGQSRGARSFDAGANAVAALCADHRRGRLSRCRISVLGRHFRAGQDAARDHREAQSRGQ